MNRSSSSRTLAVLGYVADADDGAHRSPTRPIPESRWAALVAVLAGTDSYALGIGALLHGRPGIAAAAGPDAGALITL
ncbi:hypothetical protein ACIGO9_30040 [Nocardia asteroides]|uniref:hypothetical protein n=1 Tax=Nocardia asteroides TaxID=1824 RepID=UPI0037C5885D